MPIPDHKVLFLLHLYLEVVFLGAGTIAQLVQSDSNMRELWNLSPAHHKQAAVMNALEGEAKGSEVKSHPWLSSKFKANLEP